MDLRRGLDRDPETVEQQSRFRGRCSRTFSSWAPRPIASTVSAPGDIRAFDVGRGALVWTFHTVPGTGEFSADTWPEGARATVGGANDSAEFSVDAVRGIVYVPTGSAKYNFYGGCRMETTCLPTASSHSTGAPAGGSGTSRPCITTSGIWTTTGPAADSVIRYKGRDIDVVAEASKTGYL